MKMLKLILSDLFTLANIGKNVMKCFLFALLFSLVCFNYDVFAEETALDRYIAKPDSSYMYFSYSTDRDFLYDTYFLYMASQSWRSTDEVDRNLWTHVIEITVPKIRHSNSPGTAILLVNGGSNNNNYPTKTDDQAAIIAQAMGSVVVKVSQIPNQPLYFTDEENVARREDAIIAYSFDKFLKTGDEEWPALLPMTKSVVRAMDTVQTFLADRRSITINDFIVVGGSKRGWTTWLTAAVDPRIKAIAPASIDLLNMEEQFRRHFEAYGFYAPAITDYVAFDLPNRIAMPEGQALLGIVDPYAYRERFTMPKIILNSTGDQFFLPDSSQFYFKDLPETKWLRYTPNSDHKQSMDVAKSLASWVDQINDGQTPPLYNWTIEPDGSILVVTVDRPDRVRLWQATNPNARDFRLESIGPVWTSTDLANIGPGIYRGYVPPPPQGWTAFMVELTYEESGLLEPNQVFTTDVVITPNTLPFADIDPQSVQIISGLYSATFNRAPDKAGLSYWVAQFATNSANAVRQLAAGFASHSAFTELYGSLDNLAFVNAIYVNVLGGPGDAGGISFWSNALNNGVSRSDFLAAFVEIALTVDLNAALAAGQLTQSEYAAAVIRQDYLINKADVGLYFANTLGAESNLSPGTDTSTISGLNADPAFQASQAILCGVTNDDNSVLAADALINASNVTADPIAYINQYAQTGCVGH
ncbi:MAG: PhoPQ-activated protein PqaA family protein [Gammaproteobacteria bacterium]